MIASVLPEVVLLLLQLENSLLSEDSMKCVQNSNFGLYSIML
jgi:hypothetical protein